MGSALARIFGSPHGVAEQYLRAAEHDPISRSIYIQGQIDFDWVAGDFGSVDARLRDVLTLSKDEGIIAFDANAVAVRVAVALREDLGWDLGRLQVELGSPRGPWPGHTSR